MLKFYLCLTFNFRGVRKALRGAPQQIATILAMTAASAAAVEDLSVVSLELTHVLLKLSVVNYVTFSNHTVQCGFKVPS